MRIHALLGAIADTIRAKLPALRECEPHAGRFDASELKRFIVKAPAVRVAVVAFSQAKKTTGADSFCITVRLAAFIVTKNERGLPADEGALNIAELLTLLVPNNRWGLTGLMPADLETIRADNLYDDAGLKGTAAALWAVSWAQDVKFEPDENGAAALEVYAGQAPEIGQDHAEDYEHIDPEAADA